VLLGDRRPFVAALIVPEIEKIAAELKRAAASLSDREVEEVLWLHLRRINERLEDIEKVRKIAVMKTDFPDNVRSITAFQKVKVDREAVEELYRKEIQQIYEGK
jgi:long-subunit acyl-CoA synthetase (AMP-forming)